MNELNVKNTDHVTEIIKKVTMNVAASVYIILHVSIIPLTMPGGAFRVLNLKTSE